MLELRISCNDCPPDGAEPTEHEAPDDDQEIEKLVLIPEASSCDS